MTDEVMTEIRQKVDETLVLIRDMIVKQYLPLMERRLPEERQEILARLAREVVHEQARFLDQLGPLWHIQLVPVLVLPPEGSVDQPER